MNFRPTFKCHSKKYTKEASTTIGINVSAKCEVRTLIEKMLYELANQHASDAKEAHENGKLSNSELSHSLQTIILAAACLEAFINQKAIEILKEEFALYDKGIIDAYGKKLPPKSGHPGLENKWCDITKRICGRTFNRGEQPFQDFNELLELRNYILHYKATSVPPVPSPRKDISGYVTSERAKLTSQTAQEAVKSMKEMIKEFHDLTKQKLPNWVK